jgi:hypothetical protein
MNAIRNARKFLGVTFAAAALASGFLATLSPAQATYYCHWTAAHGNVCTWSP